MPFSSPPPRYVSVFGLNENTVAATQSSKKRTIQQVNTRGFQITLKTKQRALEAVKVA